MCLFTEGSNQMFESLFSTFVATELPVALFYKYFNLLQLTRLCVFTIFELA